MHYQLNLHLVGSCIGIIIGSILYFFYINRLVAFIVGVLLRVSFWNQGPSSIWLEIGEYDMYIAFSHGKLTESAQAPYTSLRSQAESCSKMFGIIPATKLSVLLRRIYYGATGLDGLQQRRTLTAHA